ncbi:putative periplasmic protein [Hydrogenimonas sp.]|nr:putative periplasmic protein [Hydrogenimonas sp.]
MRYTLFLTIFSIVTLLYARENPFKRVIDNTVLPLASNEVKKAPPFKSSKISLPNDARVLTSVVIYYQSLDGSIKKLVTPVDRSIDWHKPIYISQSFKSVSPAGSKKAERAVKRHKKREERKGPSRESGKLFKPLPFLSLEVGEKSVKIVTKDRKIRSFHLSRPFKIALDFKRRAGFLTKRISLSKPPFKAIEIGNHDGYYRVVLTLDAPYRYRVVESGDGYIVKLP